VIELATSRNLTGWLSNLSPEKLLSDLVKIN